MPFQHTADSKLWARCRKLWKLHSPPTSHNEFVFFKTQAAIMEKLGPSFRLTAGRETWTESSVLFSPARRLMKVDEDATYPCKVPYGNSAANENGVKQGDAIVSLVQDLDDYRDGSGLRIHGNSTTWSKGNELLEDSWEIGDHFFREWWWCLDQKVIDVSNRKRMVRGLGRLRMVG
jgi:hypothetical protein